MLKAAFKSLLGRKLRLLMSTFAIVLGVAFVGGSLIFSDTLGPQLHGAVRLDRRRRRGPPGRRQHRTAPRRPWRSRPRWSTTWRACRARPGSTATSRPSASTSSTRTTRWSAARARRRSVAATPTLRPATGCRASALTDGRAPHGPDEVVFDAKTAQTVGLLHRREGAHRHRLRPGAADAEAGRHPRLPGGRLAQRRDLRRLRHPDGAGAVPRGRGRLHRHLGDG